MVTPQLIVKSSFKPLLRADLPPLAAVVAPEAIRLLIWLTAARSKVLNLVASASGDGDVGMRLLLPWMWLAALKVSLNGVSVSSSPSVSSSSSSSEESSASDDEYGGGAVSGGVGC